MTAARRPLSATICLAALVLVLASPAFGAAIGAKPSRNTQDQPVPGQWREVPPEELAMTSEPLAPGAAAVYLYTQVDRDDRAGSELVYRQIKVLTEEGRNLANVSINYEKRLESIEGIEARVIQPDGTIVPFRGQVYDRPLAAGRNVGIYAKSFTMEDVRVGSVIEYRLLRKFDTMRFLYHSRWLLNQDLFTRHAKFSLRVSSEAGVRWSWPLGLPEGTEPPKLEKNVAQMEVRNVPAFTVEEHMPPAEEVQLAVTFTYVTGRAPTSDPARFWADFNREQLAAFDRFIGQPKAVRDRLDAIVSPGDEAGVKARKIYEHVRELRNVEEPPVDGTRQPREDCRIPLSAREVGRHGCGNTTQLQLYFIALARAAGIPVVPALAAPRTHRFFQPQSMLTQGLTDIVAFVTVDGREQMLYPGFSILPYGFVPWTVTAVPAIKLRPEGPEWVTTEMPRSSDALTHRTARLTLSGDGTLEGSLVVIHAGHEAILRLAGLREMEEKDRTELMIEEVRSSISVPAEVTIMRQPDWASRTGTMETEYRIKVPQWAVTSGARTLLGAALFGKQQAGKFVSPERIHPIYFEYPFSVEDVVEITLPPGFKVQDAPAPRGSDDNALGYRLTVDAQGSMLRIHRLLASEALLVRETLHPRFRTFYDLVRTGDQQQIVLAH